MNYNTKTFYPALLYTTKQSKNLTLGKSKRHCGIRRNFRSAISPQFLLASFPNEKFWILPQTISSLIIWQTLTCI